MKSFYNFISIFLVVLYIVGVLFGIYYLTYDSSKIQRVASIFPELIYLLVTLSLVGLLGFLFLFLRRESNVEIVYTIAQDSNTNTETSLVNNLTDNHESIEQTGIARIIFTKLKQENVASTHILELSLRAICQHLEAGIGAMYVRRENMMEMFTAYALYRAEGEVIEYQLGEGLVGQVAKDGKTIKLSQIPEGYMEIVSGLGSAFPHYLTLFPVKDVNKEVVAVLELATFKNMTAQELVFLEEMALLLAREVETVTAK